jgi:hypothetical protein
MVSLFTGYTTDAEGKQVPLRMSPAERGELMGSVLVVVIVTIIIGLLTPGVRATAGAGLRVRVLAGAGKLGKIGSAIKSLRRLDALEEGWQLALQTLSPRGEKGKKDVG